MKPYFTLIDVYVNWFRLDELNSPGKQLKSGEDLPELYHLSVNLG